jgi:predicted DNA-binding protein YlxM (UPF0122 family)
MLDKTERMNILLDWYENLLTPNQRSVSTMHYRDDYSLAEIAEHTSISRSAVYDTLQRVEKILEDTETKLQCAAKYQIRKQLYQKLADLKIEAVDEYLKQLFENE